MRPTAGLGRSGFFLALQLDDAGADVGAADVDREDAVVPRENPRGTR